MKGIIFDFNGTLFDDTSKHDEAWTDIVFELTGKKPTAYELAKVTLGQTNANTLAYYMKDDNLNADFVAEWSKKKEKRYRDACLNDMENTKLIDGAIEFFEQLLTREIPFTIATSSGKDNVDFYFEVFGLSKWFDCEKIQYNDGTIRSKPEPDIFIKAAEKIGVSPEEAIVFEDSTSGITAAMNAKIGKIVAVDPELIHDSYREMECVDEIIQDYTKLDLDYLLA